jgi:hypothetical protein
MQTITIPKEDFQRLRAENRILRNSPLLKRINHILDLMYEEKYGLYMKDYTDDLTQMSINKSWNNEESAWDKL